MAVINRISTFSVFNNTLNNVNTTQANLFDLQEQISSGLKTDEFSGLQGQVEQFTFLEASVKKAKAYQENNAQNVARLRTANISLEQIIDVADEIEDLIVLRRNPGIEDDIAFEQQMRSKLDTIAAELNSQFEGQYIFGGTRTNVPPVITEPTIPGPNSLGQPDAGYYQGSTEDITLRASDSVTIQGNIRADNIAFQNLFGAAFQALSGDAADQDVLLADATDQIQTAIQDLIALKANNDANLIALEDINRRHKSLQLYWQGVTENLAKTDVVAASTQVAVDEAVLQASFQSFSSINALRLSDFLR